jgi:hypothetical protein
MMIASINNRRRALHWQQCSRKPLTYSVETQL